MYIYISYLKYTSPKSIILRLCESGKPARCSRISEYILIEFESIDIRDGQLHVIKLNYTGVLLLYVAVRKRVSGYTAQAGENKCKWVWYVNFSTICRCCAGSLLGPNSIFQLLITLIFEIARDCCHVLPFNVVRGFQHVLCDGNLDRQELF